MSVYGRTGYMNNAFLTYGEAAEQVLSAIPVMTVAASTLNLREDTSQKSKILGRYPKGTVVEVLGVGTIWNHVRINGNVGYMMAAYLEGDVSFHKTDYQGSGAVVANPDPKDRLNLRAEPSEQAISLGKFYNWTPVEVLEKRSDGWCRVRIGEKDAGTAVGYMRTAYLAFGREAANVPSALEAYRVTFATAIEKTPGGADDWIVGMQKDDVVTVLGDIGEEYCFVYTRNISGYFPRWALSEKPI